METVKGKEEITGVTYIHEHLICDLSNVRKEDDSKMIDEKITIEQLKSCVEKGVKTIVDVSCIGMGRDVIKLKKISDELNINIVCSTGFYLEQYYPLYINDISSEDISNIFIKEIEEGIEDTKIKAGIIGEIGTSKEGFTKLSKKVFESSAIASIKTNVPICTHCSGGTYAMEQGQFLLDKGVPPRNILLGHIDLCDDLEMVENVLRLGVNVGFDTIGKNNYVSEVKRIENLKYFIEKGYARQIMLSSDISRKSYYKSNGGLGYEYLIDEFCKKLLENGVSEEHIKLMMEINPREFLDVQVKKLSRKIQILKDNNIVTKKDIEVANKYIEMASKSIKINKELDIYETFETHLIMCLNRMFKNNPVEEFPEAIESEIEGRYFLKVAKDVLYSLSKTEGFTYSEEEAKFLALHLGSLQI